ncbi:MAG: SagB/ThcOx family dehydrogenase [Chloroflexi bacterium]|nr:SagB/ThcOx family dehydrogenase [Chloroflexota bacterium]
MTTQQGEAAWAYHNATKHSPESIRTNRHYMDWANQPMPYKVIENLEPMPLPRELRASSHPALASIAGHGPDRPPQAITSDDLTNLCFFSGGITKFLTHGAEQRPFRAAACTGALYHIEFYILCGDIPGLSAGVYHFGVHDFALRRLRAGDYRRVLVEATGGEPSVAGAPVVFLFTTTYWRNAWKYQARAYRHAFWDSGTILANFLAAATGNVWPAKLVMGFADEPVARLLALNREKEATVALVPLGAGADAPPEPPPVGGLSITLMPLSASEVDYPAIRAMHAASSLASGEAVKAWRGAPPPVIAPPPKGRLFPLAPLDERAVEDPVERVIMKRGSSRRFEREAITFAQLSACLRAATGGIAADYLEPLGATTSDLYLIVHAVDGLPSGSYYYRRGEGALEQLTEGDYRDTAGFLGLGQELSADASADVFFLTDLRRVLARFGDRGYRAAQMEAGIAGGRLYLSAYAQGFGASGLTFFDDEVTAFFSPHAEGKSVMFLVALGVPGRRRVEAAPAHFVRKTAS